MKGTIEKVKNSKKLKFFIAFGVAFVLFSVLGTVAVMKRGGIPAQGEKTTIATDTKPHHRPVHRRHPRKKEPEKGKATATAKKTAGKEVSVAAEKPAGQPKKEAVARKVQKTEGVKKTKNPKPEASRPAVEVAGKPSEPDRLFKGNPFAQFYIIKLDRLIAEKEKELKELQKEYQQLQESLANLKLQIAKSIEEGMKVKRRLVAKLKLNKKPSKPVLAPIKVKGITCNKLGVCTATTNFGVIAVGEKLPTGEVVKEITPSYIRTDKRVIPF